MKACIYILMIVLPLLPLAAREEVSVPAAGDLPVPAAGDLPGSEITRDEIFSGGALFGLINGGAELYHEYGFDKMAIQEIEWEGEQFRLELYRMTGPGPAFGIYSVSRHGCDSSGVVIDGDCLNKYQYQFYRGSYYLSLINYSGSPESMNLSARIGRIVSNRIDEPGFTLPLFFKEHFACRLPEVKMLKGMTGLQNALPSLASTFGYLDGYTVYYLEFEKKGEPFLVMLIETDSSLEEKTEFREALGSGFASAVRDNGSIIMVSSPDGEDMLQKFLSGNTTGR